MKVIIEIPDNCELVKDGEKYIVKEKKQVLSVEQMQRLVKLGLELKETMLYWARCVDSNPRAATHYGKWVLIKGNSAPTVGFMHWEFIPACTLQDILDKLPEEIGVERRRYWLCIDMADARMFYFTDDFQMPGASLWNTYFRDGKTLLDAAYELLVWCIEEGYVKTKGGGNDAVNDEIKQGKEKE